MPIVSNDKCKNMFLTAGRHEYIPDIFMCAGYDEGGRDSCQVYILRNKHPQLLNINSYINSGRQRWSASSSR